MSSIDNIFVVSFSNKVDTNQEDVLVYNCDIGNISYNKQSGNEYFETPIGAEVCWNSHKGSLEKDDGSIKQYGFIDIVEINEDRNFEYILIAVKNHNDDPLITYYRIEV